MINKYFPKVEKQIPYEGKDSKNPLAFKYYDKHQQVGGKSMGEHLRFSVAYWHTLMGNGSDMFGGPSFVREWHAAKDPIARAKETMAAAFEFFQKLGADYYCFHDRDIAPEGEYFSESCKNLETMVNICKKSTEGNRCQTSLGDGKVIRQSNVLSRGGHKSERARDGSRRCTNKKCHRCNKGTWR